MHRSTMIALCLSALALAACKTTPYHPSGPITANRERLWETLREVVSTRYVIDEAQTVAPKKGGDLKESVLVTKWDYDMSIEYLSSFRRKVEAKIVPYEGDEKKDAKDQRLQVMLRVVKEVNDNIDDPRSRKTAQWGDEQNDGESEETLLHHITTEHRTYTATPIPEAIPQIEPSTDRKWSRTRLAQKSREELWEALISMARGYGYQPKAEEPLVGRYESEWSPDEEGTNKLDNARKRNRLIAEVAPETAEGITRHRVQLRVEVDERRTLDEPWEKRGRDVRREETYVLKLEAKLGIKSNP